MISFLKTCGRGCVVIISSPLWLALFALYIVYGLVLFFYMLIKAIVKLFSKHHLKIETEYDRKAKAILSNPNFDPRVGTPIPPRQDMYPYPAPAPTPVYPQPQPPYQQQPRQYPPRNNYQNPPVNPPYNNQNYGGYPPNNPGPNQNPNGYPPYPPRGNNGGDQ